MLPVLIAQIVVLLKDTSLGFIIGYFELLRQARSLVEFLNFNFGNIYTLQIYVGAGVVYILINVLLSQVAKLVEKRTRSSARAAAPPRADAAYRSDHHREQLRSLTGPSGTAARPGPPNAGPGCVVPAPDDHRRV